MNNSKTGIRHVLLMMCTLLSLNVFAQPDNTLISDLIAVGRQDSGTWGMSITNFNYLRNTEYFNDIEVGRTLFGYQLNPSLFIQPNNRFKLQAGIFVQSNFGGSPSYQQVIPTFSLKVLSGKNNTGSFIFGTLEGALAHRLIEPLFDINAASISRVENGAQYKIETPKSFADLWINWEKFIERGSPFKEQFTAGASLRQQLFERKNGMRLSLIDQVLVHHHGGQIDTDTSNMIMQLNVALGLKLEQTGSSQWINVWGVDGYVTAYKESTQSGYFPYREGTGIFTNVFVRRGPLTLMGSFWQGDKWIAPKGTSLYSSVSLDKPGLTQPTRQLIFVRLLYTKTLIDGLNITARIEPVYDVKASITDYSYSLYLQYKLDRPLGRLNK